MDSNRFSLVSAADAPPAATLDDYFQGITQGWRSSLLETRAATPQHIIFQAFHHEMMPPVSEAFFPKTPQSPTASAWAIFVGMGDHFLLHIAPDFQTASVYNPCETDKENPMLAYGFMQKCSSRVMQKIRDKFPPEHSSLPPQAAFAIERSPASGPLQVITEQMLCDLIDGTSPSLQIGNFSVALMTPPSGKASLSFRHPSSPIEFWTHPSREEALKRALENTLKEHQATPLEERPRLEPRISALQGAFDLEQEISQLVNETKQQVNDLHRKTTAKRGLEEKLRVLPNNPRASESMGKAIAKMQREMDKLDVQAQASGPALKKLRDKLEEWKRIHQGELPRSYVEATFQLAVDFTDTSGNHIYKRFSESGHILTEKNDDVIRFLNEVHLAYFSARVPV